MKRKLRNQKKADKVKSEAKKEDGKVYEKVISITRLNKYTESVAMHVC
jgi:hypothetical protein